MSFMKFAPEIVRLRRVAKAYAAGEFSQLEYRRVRREVIENFHPDHFGQDDTRRRVNNTRQSQTFKRGRHLHAAAHSTEPKWQRRLLLVVLFVAVLIIANFAFAAQIVSVRERDPNPATSPRFQVSLR